MRQNTNTFCESGVVGKMKDEDKVKLDETGLLFYQLQVGKYTK